MSEKTYTSNIPGTPDMSHYQQFVLERANMTDPFTDNDYNSCIEALEKNNAVAINWEQGSTIRQLQLVSKTNLGALTFSCTRNETVESWTVAASSPHTITHDVYDVDNDITPLVNTGTKIAEGTINGQQFELFAPSGGEGNGIVYITPATTPSEAAAIVSSGKLPVMQVVAGQGYNYFYPSWIGSGLTFVHMGRYGVVVKMWDNQVGGWTDVAGYDTTLSSESTNAVQNATLYALIGNVETLLAAL